VRTHVLLALGLAMGCGSPAPVGPDAAADASVSDDAAPAEGGADAGDPIAKLKALTASCNQVSNGLFELNSGDTPTVPICGLTGAVFWKADMDIDCDGKQTTQCNSTTDPWFQNQTAATDSQGQPLDAANLPYVVVPGKSTRFDYSAAGLQFGSVILVLYNNQIEYAVFGDIGPSAIIGEASYATAAALGVNPDPQVGGVDPPDVLYVAFTGASGVASPIEDHSQAVAVGQTRLAQLLGP
jgi:hypothetical protein